MYSHVACDVMKERTLYLLKPSSLIWHLMPYLFLFKNRIQHFPIVVICLNTILSVLIIYMRDTIRIEVS